MKLKKVKIIIQSIDSIKKEWSLALQGKLRYIQPKDTLIFPNIETLGKLLSPTRLELLQAIIQRKPKSIYALAKLVDRDFKNVHTDVKILTNVGLIELRASGKRASLAPIAKYSGYELDLAA